MSCPGSHPQIARFFTEPDSKQVRDSQAALTVWVTNVVLGESCWKCGKAWDSHSPDLIDTLMIHLREFAKRNRKQGHLRFVFNTKPRVPEVLDPNVLVKYDFDSYRAGAFD